MIGFLGDPVVCESGPDPSLRPARPPPKRNLTNRPDGLTNGRSPHSPTPLSRPSTHPCQGERGSKQAELTFSLFSPEGWVEGWEKRVGVMRGQSERGVIIFASHAHPEGGPFDRPGVESRLRSPAVGRRPGLPEH